MPLPAISGCKPRQSILAFRSSIHFCTWRAFVIAVIASSVVNNCAVSTDEAVPEAPSIIGTEAAVKAPGA